jgi:hypothetical protein
MAKVEKSPERREHERRKLHAGAFATLSPHPSVAGQILNISEGGLSFRYIASRDHLRDASHLNILMTNGSFALRNISIKPVWDHATPNSFAAGLTSMRHGAVKFGDLTDEQRSDLKIFFQNHTASPAESK